MEGNNVRSFENLCKIFEMRIKLDREKFEFEKNKHKEDN